VNRTGTAILLGACLACAPTTPQVPLFRVEQAGFSVETRALGELQAARSTALEISATLRGIQRIAWILPDGSPVEEGQLVARLDADRIDKQLTTLRSRLRKLDFQLDAKKQELTKELTTIRGQLALLAQEYEDAKAIAPRDERLFSRHEIIDAQINIELIETKIAHFEEQLERARAKEETEMEILRLQRRTQEVRIDQLEKQKLQLEIRAPHAGFFLAGRTWQGEKVRIGMELWAGQALGELPDLAEMEAKVHVLESEAAGLADGLEAEVLLDAHPGHATRGIVKAIQPVANAIEENSPVKYFEVVLALEETDTATMKPGSQVHVTIEVANDENVITVPNQAIFVEQGTPSVFVAGRGGFERRPVELGLRSVSRTVISAGLNPGESIALVDPMNRPEAG
jgi:RND family efflux transporter MFP subunit